MTKGAGGIAAATTFEVPVDPVPQLLGMPTYQLVLRHCYLWQTSNDLIYGKTPRRQE